MSRFRHITYSLLLIFLIVSGIGIGREYAMNREPSATQEIQPAQTEEGLIEAELIVSNERYPQKIPSGSTALHLMRQAEATTPLTFTGRDFSGLGFFVERINGIENTRDMVWIYYINDTKANVGISTYIVQPGDIITWRYEKNTGI